MLNSVWVATDFWSCRSSMQFLDFRELLGWIMQQQKQPELFAFTVWGIWTQRNRTRVQQPGCSLQQLAQESKCRLTEFIDINPLPQPRPPLPRARWKPPPTDLVKINFDGAVFSDVNKSGVGAVARNCNGAVLASMSQQIPQAYKPEEVEALAARFALQFALDIGCTNLILEGDSKNLMTWLSNDSEVLSYGGLLLDDIRRLSSFFSQLHYSHIRREGNNVAHSLARYAAHISDFLVWMENVPPQFSAVIQADLAGVS
ncbi:hypothetical protein SO802_008367 [Lithocarpus litseifolius]|uniref:RNase H type-1 domain-containing protein n=1 Tax=Lithocarpus litseifolius TaxID=425828 RepID=A0AAW2DCC3_9ROSI